MVQGGRDARNGFTITGPMSNIILGPSAYNLVKEPSIIINSNIVHCELTLPAVKIAA